jgi:hypothetical protein
MLLNQPIAQQICCPNCGSRQAERHYLPEQELIRTQCADCDYLLITCAATARVVEAYVPGVNKLAAQLRSGTAPAKLRETAHPVVTSEWRVVA